MRAADGSVDESRHPGKGKGLIDLSRTLYDTKISPVSDRLRRELWMCDSRDSYPTLGEVREAVGTPVTGFYGVENKDLSLS